MESDTFVACVADKAYAKSSAISVRELPVQSRHSTRIYAKSGTSIFLTGSGARKCREFPASVASDHSQQIDNRRGFWQCGQKPSERLERYPKHELATGALITPQMPLSVRPSAPEIWRQLRTATRNVGVHIFVADSDKRSAAALRERCAAAWLDKKYLCSDSIAFPASFDKQLAVST